MRTRIYKLKGSKVPTQFQGLELTAPVFETEEDVAAKIPSPRSRIANQQSAFDVSWQDFVRRVSGKKDQTAEGIQKALDGYTYEAREESTGESKSGVTKAVKEKAAAAMSGLERAVRAGDQKKIRFYVSEGLATDAEVEAIRTKIAGEPVTA